MFLKTPIRQSDRDQSVSRTIFLDTIPFPIIWSCLNASTMIIIRFLKHPGHCPGSFSSHNSRSAASEPKLFITGLCRLKTNQLRWKLSKGDTDWYYVEPFYRFGDLSREFRSKRIQGVTGITRGARISKYRLPSLRRCYEKFTVICYPSVWVP